MGQSTRELRRDIEDTRDHLGATLDTIGDRVSPRKVVHRRTQRVKERIGSLRDSVMGTVSSAEESVQSGAHAVAEQASSAAGAVVQEARQAPEQVLQTTQGNPLAAGLVAFGLGMVVASLIPPSETGTSGRDGGDRAARATQGPGARAGLGDEGSRAGSCRDAVDDVKATARDAAGEIGDAAQTAASDIKDEARSAAHEVKDDVTDPNGERR